MAYCDKENVNVLTALLVKHRVRKAVVCPGSRNAPIVHNLNECPDITCYPVTDERSAGFYALGIALNQGAPSAVAVCVTSGTALLNLLPAVAEAWYQHVPLVVISADRPQAWIDQLDGQTLPQPDALGRFVRTVVTLPEDLSSDEQHWYCNRLVNEALLDMRYPVGSPVHINVPISEPLFHFTTEQLPDERRIVRRFHYGDDEGTEEIMINDFLKARRPMIVIGQTHADFVHSSEWRDVMQSLSERFVVLSERLCNYGIETIHFDEVLYRIGDDERYMPDRVLHIGDTLVSKRLKGFLRKAKELQVYRLSREGSIQDTFMHLTEVTVCHPEHALTMLASVEEPSAADSSFLALWQQALAEAYLHAATYQPAYSQMAAVKCFEEYWKEGFVHYANSTAIRLANIYARHSVFCNRGVNGIEGSLSTAAGMSIGSKTFCIIGDLSFFYDQNALWNQNLNGNLRILLLNNGRGGIFNQLHGLEQSAARDRLVAAEHHASAEGICMQNEVAYMKAIDAAGMEEGIHWLLTQESARPLLLEVFTEASEDERMYRDYYQSLRTM